MSMFLKKFFLFGLTFLMLPFFVNAVIHGSNYDAWRYEENATSYYLQPIWWKGDASAIFDGVWAINDNSQHNSTVDSVKAGAYAYVNYSKNSSAGFVWQVQYCQNNNFYNVSFNANENSVCFNAFSDVLALRIGSHYAPQNSVVPDCWNGTAWINSTIPVSCAAYPSIVNEEAMYVNLTWTCYNGDSVYCGDGYYTTQYYCFTGRAGYSSYWWYNCSDTSLIYQIISGSRVPFKESVVKEEVIIEAHSNINVWLRANITSTDWTKEFFDDLNRFSFFELPIDACGVFSAILGDTMRLAYDNPDAYIPEFQGKRVVDVMDESFENFLQNKDFASFIVYLRAVVFCLQADSSVSLVRWVE